MSNKSLDFIIGLVDKFSPPLKGVLKSVEKLEKATNKTTKSLQKIGTGAIAIWGIGKAFSALIDPAQEMQKALDLASIGGVNDLDKMRKHAKLFAGEYAINAVDFVNSSVLIKNSINGITDRALPKMTEKVNLLAKATGVSANESTKYMAQMYDDYKQTAIKMGGLNFADKIAGMAAYAKQNFNMSPAQMQSMMSGSKNAGANYGVDMSAQFAILGTLNKSMGGSGASAYEKMLNNMQSAGKQLGLTFVDTNGKLLAMPDILTKLQDKFGQNIDGNISAQNALNAAFGDGAPAIKALIKDSDKLNEHITALGNNDGLSLTQKMAEANVKPWDKINAKMGNIMETIGHALLPVFDIVFEAIDSVISNLTCWLDMFPNIAKWVGIIAAAFIGFSAISAVLTIVSGVLSGLIPIFSAIKLIVIGVTFVVKLLGAAFMSLTWPVALVILAIAGIATAIYFIYKYWDDIWAWMSEAIDVVTHAIGDFIDGAKGWFSELFNTISNSAVFKALTASFSLVGALFGAVIELITGNWDRFVDTITNNKMIKRFMSIGKNIGEIFNSVVKYIKNIFIDSINWIIDKANYIPGVNIDLIKREDADTHSNLLTGTRISDIEPGGISQEIQNSQSKSIDNSQNIQSVNFTMPGGMTPEQLKEWEFLKHG